MALKQTYLSMESKLPTDSEVVLVMRGKGNDELAPSKELLDDFNEAKKHYTPGSGFASAIHYAWEKSHYEERFRNQITQDAKAMTTLRELTERGRDHDVYLVCYEGEDKPCHRRLLLEIAGEAFDAEVDPSPFSSKSDSKQKHETLPLFERVS